MPAPTRLLQAAAPTRKAPVARAPVRQLAAAPHLAQQLQRRLGNAGTLALLQAVAVRERGQAAGAAAVKARLPAKAEPGAAPPAARSGVLPNHESRSASPSPRVGQVQRTAVLPPAGSATSPARPGGEPAGAVPAAGVAATSAQTGALAPSIAAIHTAAAAQKTHRPGAAVIASAQAAAVEPVTEQRRAAAVQTIGRLDQVEPAAMARDSIRATLRAAIAGATPAPKTEADAEKLISGGAKEASEALRGQLADARATADGPLKGAAASEVAPASQPVSGAPSLALEAAPPPPAVPDAAFAVPGPAPAGRPDCSAHEAEASRPLVEGGVSEAQLARGREPAFRLALDARAKAGAHSHGVGARYRKIESGIREQTLGMAQRALASDLGGMHAVRGTRGALVGAHQLAAKARDAAARQQITARIAQTKDRTRADVDRILEPLEKEASTCFEAGLQRAEEAYAAAFSEARGGFGAWLSTWGEAWRSHIEAALASARGVYMQHVDAAIEAVARYVDEQLARARRRVQEGRKEVERDIGGLDANLRQFGAEALEAVSAEFDAMAGQIDARRDGLVDRLAQQYKSSLERMDSAEQGLRDENRGLWERAHAATLGVVEQVLAFKAMLLGVLAEAAAVVGDILANPIGFLRNLVAGIGLGLRNFLANIGSHLKKGLMEWIFGVLSGAGVQMPDSFDLKGIASIVMQVMGLTYANIRARAVAIVGEKVVSGLEKTAEVFKILITEGIPGLWQLIKDKLTDLKSMVLDGIFSFIHEKVIVAGITWIVSLLNPASAFFKACKAIYDIVSFFIERGAQLAALAKAVIASVGAIARGAIGTAANWIETSLARAIPMVIGFLAGLLGLGDISGTIRKLIDKAQAPVNKAVDWVVRKGVAATRTAMSAAKSTAREIVEWWSQKFQFSDGKEKHSLYFSKKGEIAELTVASTPRALRAYLNRIEKAAPGEKIVRMINKIRGYIDTIEKETTKNPTNPKRDVISAAFEEICRMLPELGPIGTPKYDTTTVGVNNDDFERASFREKVKEMFIVERGKEDRRHIVSSQDMIDHYTDALAGKTLREAANALLESGQPVEKKLTQKSIENSIKKRYRDFFNDPANLFVGPSSENRSQGRKIDMHKKGMGKDKLGKHIDYIRIRWSLRTKKLKITGYSK